MHVQLGIRRCVGEATSNPYLWRGRLDLPSGESTKRQEQIALELDGRGLGYAVSDHGGRLGARAAGPGRMGRLHYARRGRADGRISAEKENPEAKGAAWAGAAAGGRGGTRNPADRPGRLRHAVGIQAVNP